MHALFGLETEFAIENLHGDGDEDSVAGYAEKICPIGHVDIVMDDVDGNQFGHTFEAFGRTLDAEVAIKHVELVHACRCSTDRHWAGATAGVGEAPSFGGATHEFAQTQASTGNMCESVFFARVSRDVVFAGTPPISKFTFSIFSHPFQLALAPHP